MILGPIKRKKKKEAAEDEALSITDSMGVSLKQTLGVEGWGYVLQSIRLQRDGHNLGNEQQQQNKTQIEVSWNSFFKDAVKQQ